jgi:hypothetical protein
MAAAGAQSNRSGTGDGSHSGHKWASQPIDSALFRPLLRDRRSTAVGPTWGQLPGCCNCGPRQGEASHVGGRASNAGARWRRLRNRSEADPRAGMTPSASGVPIVDRLTEEDLRCAGERNAAATMRGQRAPPGYALVRAAPAPPRPRPRRREGVPLLVIQRQPGYRMSPVPIRALVPRHERSVRGRETSTATSAPSATRTWRIPRGSLRGHAGSHARRGERRHRSHGSSMIPRRRQWTSASSREWTPSLARMLANDCVRFAR